MDTEEDTIGLVLSGGGVRGMAHIGLIKALEEAGIRPNLVSGSSVGALVGALYANDCSVKEMLSFFKETPLFRYNFFSLSKPGLLDTERYFNLFSKYFPHNAFDALKRELIVVATDLQRGEGVFFDQGELIHPLLASAALPPIFGPVHIDGQLYADGGIMNNFPSEPIRDRASLLIGSNVSVVKQMKEQEIKTSFQLANRTTSLMIYAINREKIHNCDLLFEPKALEKIGVLDKKGIEKAYEIGYQHAKETLKAHPDF